MTMRETETETRLRRATEALAAAREAENEARRALASAVQTTARAKERYSELFERWQQEEVKSRLTDYRHATK